MAGLPPRTRFRYGLTVGVPSGLVTGLGTAPWARAAVGTTDSRATLNSGSQRFMAFSPPADAARPPGGPHAATGLRSASPPVRSRSASTEVKRPGADHPARAVWRGRKRYRPRDATKVSK